MAPLKQQSVAHTPQSLNCVAALAFAQVRDIHLQRVGTDLAVSVLRARFQPRAVRTGRSCASVPPAPRDPSPAASSAPPKLQFTRHQFKLQVACYELWAGCTRRAAQVILKRELLA